MAQNEQNGLRNLLDASGRFRMKMARDTAHDPKPVAAKYHIVLDFGTAPEPFKEMLTDVVAQRLNLGIDLLLAEKRSPGFICEALQAIQGLSAGLYEIHQEPSRVELVLKLEADNRTSFFADDNLRYCTELTQYLALALKCGLESEPAADSPEEYTLLVGGISAYHVMLLDPTTATHPPVACFIRENGRFTNYLNTDAGRLEAASLVSGVNGPVRK